jgi:serine/threonine protein kinase
MNSTIFYKQNMENYQTSALFTHLPLDSGEPDLIALPDGKEKIALGSGVVTKLLGRGGMAAVYEIWNPRLEVYRAVKLINPGAIDLVQQRFQTEYKISAKLKHPNIIEIHGVGEWNNLTYIEMEKIDGTRLDRIVSERGALPAAVCTAIGIMICRALAYAHQQDCTIYGKTYHGVIHRDLKPQNMMINTAGVVKLMDFGVARPVDVSFQTVDGLVSGTLQFLAPEQIEKKKLDVRTDLYSLGVTMYEVATGVNPFPQSTLGQLISSKTKNKFRPIGSFRFNVPGRLKKIIHACMQQDPKKRPATAAVLLKELTKIHNSLTTKSPEEIMSCLVTDPSNQKIILATHRRIPLGLIATLGIVSVTGFFLSNRGIHFLKDFNFYETVSLFSQKLGLNALSVTPNISENKGLPQGPPNTVSSLADSNALLSTNSAEKSVSNKNKKSSRKKSLIELLKEKYSINDTLAIMEKEWNAKNFDNVLSLYGFLSKEQARLGLPIILTLRSLDALDDKVRLVAFIEKNDLNDGEFYLAKAKLALRNRNLPGAKLMLEVSLSSPHAFIDYDNLKREVYFLAALVATAEFDNTPDEHNYKAALDAWWLVKSILRSAPEHDYNKKAAAELQRLAHEMQRGD